MYMSKYEYQSELMYCHFSEKQFVSYMYCFRKLTQRERELIIEFAKLEDLKNGSVTGVQQGQRMAQCTIVTTFDFHCNIM